MKNWLSMHRKTVLLLAFYTGLISCGNADDTPFGQIISTTAALVSTDRAETAAPSTRLTPSVVAAVQEPFILVSLPERRTSATFRTFARIDGKTDWRGSEGISLVMSDGILVATRGLGADLFLAEATGLNLVLNSSSGLVTRRHSVLDGESRERRTNYRCSLASEGGDTVDLIARQLLTQKVSETCIVNGSSSIAFRNEYWIGLNDGLVWQSRQWVSDEVGYLLIQHLRR